MRIARVGWPRSVGDVGALFVVAVVVSEDVCMVGHQFFEALSTDSALAQTHLPNLFQRHVALKLFRDLITSTP